jgi:hypothetical protein
MHTTLQLENLTGSDCMEDVNVNARTVLKGMLKKENMRTVTEFNWLKTESCGTLL